MDRTDVEMEALERCGRRVVAALASSRIHLVDLFSRYDHHDTGFVHRDEVGAVLKFVGLAALDRETFERRFCSKFADGRCFYRDVARFVELADPKALGYVMRGLSGALGAWHVDAMLKAFEAVDRRRSGRVTLRVFRGVLLRFFFEENRAKKKKQQPAVSELLVQQLSSRFAHPRDSDTVLYGAFLAALDAATPLPRRAKVVENRRRGANPLMANNTTITDDDDDERLWRHGTSPKKQHALSGEGSSSDLFAPAATWAGASPHRDKPVAALAAVTHSALGAPSVVTAPDELPGERLRQRSLIRNKKPTWACVVCFFSENSTKADRCEICGAADASGADAEVYVECPNCAFPNPDVSSGASLECQICQVKLCSRRAAQIITDAQRPRQGRPPKLTHDGWSMACFQDDGDDLRTTRRPHGGRASSSSSTKGDRLWR